MFTSQIVTKRFRIHEELRNEIFAKIIEGISLEELEKSEIGELKDRITAIARDELREAPLTHHERNKIIGEIINEITGYGPIEPLLKDGTISDIVINSHDDVFIERYGRLERVNVRFRSSDHLMHTIRKLVAAAGRRIDESTPMVDAFLRDGSRVNAIIPPVVFHPAVSIRKFIKLYTDINQLVAGATLSREMAEFLGLCVQGKLNILISGGTGTGKTTLLGTITKFIPDSERVVTVEDSFELLISKPDLVRLVTRIPNVEGKGSVTQRQLVINCLRMRPDRIIVGEVRGEEVWDMLQAMNTGHAGSITTVHANSSLDALFRIETMAMLTGYEIAEMTLRTIITRSIDIVVHLSRFITGERKVVQISEVSGLDGTKYQLDDVFRFVTGSVVEGRVEGSFRRLKTVLSNKIVEKLSMGGADTEAINGILKGI